MKLHVDCWDMYEKAMNEAEIRVAIDAGANDGGYSWTLLQHGFEVYAFEPVPIMFKKMQERIGSNPKAHLCPMGLSDVNALQQGVIVLGTWTIGKPSMGGLKPKPEMKDMPPFDMATVRIDDFFKGDAIGLIKLDVDGYEFKVLRGAEQTIKRWKPPILCEFGCYLEKCGEDPQEFVEFIFDLGYDVVSMDGKSVFTSWKQIQPQWPYHTTFDVMLMPK